MSKAEPTMRANPLELSRLLAAARVIAPASNREHRAIHGDPSVNLENLSHAMADRALQGLYRDLIETAIAAAPPDCRQAMREMQGRLDAARLPDGNEVLATEALSAVFKSFMPTNQCSAKDSP
jgi:hypothetical protein